MKKSFRLLILIFSPSIFISCTKSVNITDHIDKYLPFTLTITKTDSATHMTTYNRSIISPNSTKFKKIIQWANDNTSGWHRSYASYIAQISITQNNFRLLEINKGVAIGFTDDAGKEKLYSKTIEQNQLKFLSE